MTFAVGLLRLVVMSALAAAGVYLLANAIDYEVRQPCVVHVVLDDAGERVVSREDCR